MRTEGQVNRISPGRGFGFIEVSERGTRDIFFHVSQLAGELQFDDQLVGQHVQFTMTENEKGLTAVDVQPA